MSDSPASSAPAAATGTPATPATPASATIIATAAAAASPTSPRPKTVHRWAAFMPAVFVVIWSTGFIVAKYGLPYSPPLTFLLLRYIGVVIVLLPMVVIARVPWPRGSILHIAVAGVMLQALYLAGVWTAIKMGAPAGLTALIVGMQPVLTALFASLVGERVRARQWLGLAMGFCGVALVVANKISLIGLSAASIALVVMSLLSITVGTLYQKRFCAHFDLRTGTLVQFIASIGVTLPFAMYFEHLTPALDQVQWTAQFVWSLLWSVLALSIGAIFLLFILIREGAATRVTSLLYLTPVVTALFAWLLFGERFSLIGAMGMAIAVLGVAFVVRKTSEPDVAAAD